MTTSDDDFDDYGDHPTAADVARVNTAYDHDVQVMQRLMPYMTDDTITVEQALQRWRADHPDGDR